MVRLSLRKIAAKYHHNTAETASKAQVLVEVLEREREIRQDKIHQ